MKRRLQKMHRKLLALHPKRPPTLLVQPCVGGHYFVDTVVAARYIPGLLREEGEDPMVECLKKIEEVRNLVLDIHQGIGLAPADAQL